MTSQLLKGRWEVSHNNKGDEMISMCAKFELKFEQKNEIYREPRWVRLLIFR